MQQVAIIDYHMGNLRSVAKALEKSGDGKAQVHISQDPAVIAGADRVVFPGQGAARDCMRELNLLGLIGCICDAINTRPFLGICTGLQVLLEGSDESPATPRLGVLPGQVRKLPAADSAGRRLRIPQMGWNQVLFCQQLLCRSRGSGCRCRTHPLWLAFCQRRAAPQFICGTVSSRKKSGRRFAPVA